MLKITQLIGERAQPRPSAGSCCCYPGAQTGHQALGCLVPMVAEALGWHVVTSHPHGRMRSDRHTRKPLISPPCLPRSNPPCDSPLSPDSSPQHARCRLHAPLTPSRGPWGMNHVSLSRLYFSCFKKSTYSSYYSEDGKKKLPLFLA